MEKDIEIGISSESQRFYQFLSQPNNDRIVFSGKFGIGKTYFIDKFFNEGPYSKVFIPIYISPVNYAIASNEDIFEYIKVNILFELLKEIPCDFTKLNISFTTGAYYYLKENSLDIIANIFSKFEKLSLGTDFIDYLLKLKKDIDKFIVENKRDEKDEIECFVKELSEKKGSLYENDIISQIIRTLINTYKNDNNKKLVFIVDDLDRIDPEHIFRIMNVLSAHDDFCGDNQHKFGFDKTILICDIENIKNIYHGHHGIDVDFNGYIDKFYSKEIYHFRNIDNIIDTINLIISNTYAEGENISNIFDPEWRKLFNYTIKNLLIFGELNLRTLLKLVDKNIDMRRIIRLTSYNKILNSDSPAIIFFDILNSLYSTPTEMYNSIRKIEFERYKANEYISKSFMIIAGYNPDFMSEDTHKYNGHIFTIQQNSFMASIPDLGTFISGDELIKDACKNYVNYFI